MHLIGLSGRTKTINLLTESLLVVPWNFALDPQHMLIIRPSCLNCVKTPQLRNIKKLFEKLCNRVLGLNPEMILNCFISGLLLKIQREIVV